MHKLWTLFCLGLVLASVYSQSCADTASLRTFFGFGNTITTPTAQTGINFCNSIKNGPVCCTAADMNTFQTKSDAAIATLTAQAAARDTAFSAIGGQNPAAVQNQVAAAAATLNTAVTTKGGSFAALVKQANSSGLLPPPGSYAGFGSFSSNVNPINVNSPAAPYVPGKSSNPSTVVGNVTGLGRSLQSIYNNTAATSVSLYGVLANLDSIKAQLGNASAAVTANTGTFQSARSTCVVQMYQIQAAAWCLSCDLNATLKGYDPNYKTLTPDSDMCGRLKTACFPYLQSANLQNSAFNQKMLLDTLTYATNALNNGGNPLGQSFTYTGQQPAAFPSNCATQDQCNWICNSMFNNGQVNTASLIDGGVVASTSSRLLEEEAPRQLTERVLASGTFNPSNNEAGTSVTFAADPAGINSNNAKSAMLTFGSVAGGMIAMVWSMMM